MYIYIYTYTRFCKLAALRLLQSCSQPSDSTQASGSKQWKQTGGTAGKHASADKRMLENEEDTERSTNRSVFIMENDPRMKSMRR